MRFHFTGIKCFYCRRIFEINTGLFHIITTSLTETVAMRLINIEPKTIGLVAFAQFRYLR